MKIEYALLLLKPSVFTGGPYIYIYTVPEGFDESCWGYYSLLTGTGIVGIYDWLPSWEKREPCLPKYKITFHKLKLSSDLQWNVHIR